MMMIMATSQQENGKQVSTAGLRHCAVNRRSVYLHTFAVRTNNTEGQRIKVNVIMDTQKL